MFGLYRKRTPPLGDLERDVMEVLWRDGNADAQAIHERLAGVRGVTLSTVQSTVERLTRKGLVARHKRGRAYCYTAPMSRETLLARLVAELVHDLSGTEPAGSVGLVDLSTDIDETTLQQLEDWVAETRRQRGRDDGTGA